MAITAITRDQGINVSIVRLTTTDAIEDVAATDYIADETPNITALNNGEWEWQESDMVLVSAADGHGFFEFDGDDFATLIPLPAGNGEVTLPVVSGNFTMFDGTLGGLADDGYSPTDATKTKVVMADAAVTSGNIPTFTDTAGTIGNGPVAANRVLTTGFATPDVAADIVSFDVTVGQAALATGGTVVLVNSSGSKQYRIRELFLNSGGTNFSGGGGDRNGQVTDGTTVYSVVPAATMQSLANSRWGQSTPLPYPAAAAIFTASVAGADIVFSYSGGTTDYTAGSLRISGLAERIA